MGRKKKRNRIEHVLEDSIVHYKGYTIERGKEYDKKLKREFTYWYIHELTWDEYTLRDAKEFCDFSLYLLEN